MWGWKKYALGWQEFKFTTNQIGKNQCGIKEGRTERERERQKEREGLKGLCLPAKDGWQIRVISM